MFWRRTKYIHILNFEFEVESESEPVLITGEIDTDDKILTLEQYNHVVRTCFEDLREIHRENPTFIRLVSNIVVKED